MCVRKCSIQQFALALPLCLENHDHPFPETSMASLTGGGALVAKRDQ
jgi:hypothetical protein